MLGRTEELPPSGEALPAPQKKRDRLEWVIGPARRVMRSITSRPYDPSPAEEKQHWGQLLARILLFEGDLRSKLTEIKQNKGQTPCPVEKKVKKKKNGGGRK